MENIDNNVKFTEEENKIRKKWLFLSTILPALTLALVVGICIIVLLLGYVNPPDFQAMIGFGLLFAISVCGFYIPYYCAYKNPGTILLLFGMIGYSYSIVKTVFDRENLALIQDSPGFSIFLLFLLFYELILFYYSFKLRKINKKMQERRLIASPVYSNAISVFSTAKNLDELDEQFSKMKNSDDSTTAKHTLAKAYEQQKKTLKLANI